jgi:hypothetical protein
MKTIIVFLISSYVVLGIICYLLIRILNTLEEIHDVIKYEKS